MLAKNKFITDDRSGTIYMYNNAGRYIEAESIIKNYASAMMGGAVTKNAVSEVVEHIRRTTYTSFSQIPQNLNLINVLNGVYDLSTDTLLPHTPQYIFFSQIPVKYNPSAECKNIDRFFRSIVRSEDVEVLYEICGYCLYRAYPIQQAFVCTGEGSNGKSTFLSLLTAFLGKENVSSISLQKISDSSNRFLSSALRNKLANICADLPTKAITDTGEFKKLTGNDLIFGEEKFKNSFSFYNTAKFIFSANFLPEINDQSYAFWRRWIVIQFPNKFEGKDRDPNILNKLTIDEELSGLLNHCIKSLKNLLSTGSFSSTNTDRDVLTFWENRSNSVVAFLHEQVEVTKTPNDFVPKDELYKSYVEFCKDNDFFPKSREWFSRALIKVVPSTFEYRKVNGNNVRCWIGLRLKGKEIKETGIEKLLSAYSSFEKGEKKEDFMKIVKYADEIFLKKKKLTLDDLLVELRDFTEEPLDIAKIVEELKKRGNIAEIENNVFVCAKE